MPINAIVYIDKCTKNEAIKAYVSRSNQCFLYRIVVCKFWQNSPVIKSDTLSIKKSLHALFSFCLVLSKMYIINIFIIIFATITTELALLEQTLVFYWEMEMPIQWVCNNSRMYYSFYLRRYFSNLFSKKRWSIYHVSTVNTSVAIVHSILPSRLERWEVKDFWSMFFKLN